MDDIIRFSKFDGGTIRQAEGLLLLVGDKTIKVRHEDQEYEFSRSPGPKAGYGLGKAKSWRLGQPDRAKYCYPDLPTKRR